MAASSSALPHSLLLSRTPNPREASIAPQQCCQLGFTSRPSTAWRSYGYSKGVCDTGSSCCLFWNGGVAQGGLPGQLGCCLEKRSLGWHDGGALRGKQLSRMAQLRQLNKERWSGPRAEIKIDRRRHLEEAFKRQQEEEARWAEAEVSCPLDCVREVRSTVEFDRILRDAERNNELVVMDFYNSACGSCKYVGRQFVKLCKSEACSVEGGIGGVVFVKHNVRDEYDDLTAMARLYSIKVVPMFSFFIDGCRVEQFPTRDRKRLEETLARLLSR